MQLTATKELWLEPQPHSMDRGRLEEWNKYARSIDCRKQLKYLQNPSFRHAFSRNPFVLICKWLILWIPACAGMTYLRVLQEAQLIAQIVISPKSIEYTLSPEEIKNTWLQSFISRVGDMAPDRSFEIGHHETEKFVVLA